MANQVPLTRQALEKVVKEYKRVKASHFKLTYELKPKQINNAIRRYASGVRPEEVVALMDTTLFDSGKEGYLITTTHMYGDTLKGKRIDLNRVSKLHRDDSYLTVTYPDGTSEKHYVSIFDRDLFNFLGDVMDASTALQPKKTASSAPVYDKIVDASAVKASAPKASAPKTSTPKSSVSANPEALFQKGSAAFLSKDYDTAKSCFRQAANQGHKTAGQYLRQLEIITSND